MPDAYGELAHAFDLLEKHYKDMQDIEFTVQQNKLWMLQTRSGKRTAKAALKMAVDMVGEGLIDDEDRHPARRSDGARSIAAPHARSASAARCAHHRPACLTGRGIGQDRA